MKPHATMIFEPSEACIVQAADSDAGVGRNRHDAHASRPAKERRKSAVLDSPKSIQEFIKNVIVPMDGEWSDESFDDAISGNIIRHPK